MAATGDRRIHTVLGMHRSGTSMLTGSLQEKGLELGDVNEAADFNKKGNRENPVVRDIHDRVLARSGGAWDDVPAEIVWPPGPLQRLRTFIESMNARYDRWGFKDPRTVLVLDGWRRLVPEGLACVGVYRHPRSVARSLANRLPMPVDQGIALWRAYNGRLIAEHRREGFPILRFDTDPDRLRRDIEVVARTWALPEASKPSTFFDSQLRHHDADMSTDIPDSCRDAWDYLEAHRLTP